MSGQNRNLRLVLAGDVMTGRGIDQILPYPGAPELYEGYMGSAEDYVRLAERLNGPIPRPVGFDYVWGDLLAEAAFRNGDFRIVNLETAVTKADRPEPKGINYRMHPANIGVLTTASINACTLANNHVLDWGHEGLVETLTTLDAVGIASAGAGRAAREAARPAILRTQSGNRVILVAFGARSSGVPSHWAAGPQVAGINILPRTTAAAVEAVREQIEPVQKNEDVVIASLHWGDNWGFDVPEEQRELAHALIDTAGIDILFGHSSHHAKNIEIYRGKLILYGCGDLINDYEGIRTARTYERFRDNLAQAYFVGIDPTDGRLTSLEIRQFKRYKFCLTRTDGDALDWLAEVLRGQTETGLRFDRVDDHILRLDLH